MYVQVDICFSNSIETWIESVTHLQLRGLRTRRRPRIAARSRALDSHCASRTPSLLWLVAAALGPLDVSCHRAMALPRAASRSSPLRAQSQTLEDRYACAPETYWYIPVPTAPYTTYIGVGVTMCDQHIANAAFTGRTASRSQAQASRRSSYSMMRPGLAQCDSVLQLRVGPKRRLVFE